MQCLSEKDAFSVQLATIAATSILLVAFATRLSRCAITTGDSSPSGHSDGVDDGRVARVLTQSEAINE